MKISRDRPLILRGDYSAWNWIERRLFARSRTERGFYQHMFRQDMMLLFSAMGSRETPPFQLDSTNPELTEQLLAKVTRRYRPRLQELLVELTAKIAESFLASGNSFYWVMHDQKGRPNGIIDLNSQRVFSFFGQVVQYSPPGVQLLEDYSEVCTKREIRALDRRQLLIFKLPRPIWLKIARQNRVLRALDNSSLRVPLAFQPKVTHENPNVTTHFNFARWRTLQDLALYKGTREIGWNGRMSHDEKRSDFFDCVRLLRFRRVQFSLRDAILQQLSTELCRVGREYDPQFCITIRASENLQSIAQLDEIASKLEREEVSFTEVINFCFAKGSKLI